MFLHHGDGARRKRRDATDGSCIYGSHMLDELQITIARSAERRARRKLEKGCADDLAALDWSKSPKAILDNANIRFRARFRTYAETVWETETRLIARPRRVAVPRLHVRTTVSLHRQDLRALLEREVEVAREKLIRRVVASVARSRAARALRS